MPAGPGGCLYAGQAGLGIRRSDDYDQTLDLYYQERGWSSDGVPPEA